MTRWKLLVGVCLVAAVISYGTSSARSPSRPTGLGAHRQQAHGAMRFLAVRPLARGRLPGKQTFTIIGERYRFQGRVYFTLAISIDRPGEPRGGGGGGSFNPSQTPGMLAYTALVECAPHPYAVVFGLLRAPSDTVVARSGNEATVLQRASIPAVLHAHGVLAYARLAGPPSEVLVQRPGGKRLRDDRLGGGRCSPGMLIILQPLAHQRS